MTKQIPVSKNQIIECMIHTLGHEGQGIGKYEDFTVFVAGALPGERISTRIIKVEKRYAVGRIIDILEPSEVRREPKCAIFKRCGGCQVQHMDYQAQLQWKRQMVADHLERIGKLSDVFVHPTIGMDIPWHYRNKAQVPVGECAVVGQTTQIQGVQGSGKCSLISGFYAARSHEIIPFDTCDIQHRANNQLVAEVRKIAEKHGVSAYNERTHKGLLRHIVVRTAFQTDEIMVTMVINGKQLPHQEQIIREVAALSENVCSICVNQNRDKTNVIFGDKTEVLYGSDKIFDYIGNIRFGISARSFYQVNPVQTEILYRKALEYAGLTGTETVIDAYCGIGTISLFLAQQAKKVYGVEIVSEAIEDARYNAAINGMENVEFAVAKAEEWIPKLYKKLTENVESGLEDHVENDLPEVIVVDPPRKGCDQALLDTIIAMKPQRVVYVSCDSSTLARDLRILVDGGFEVKEVQPVDMFPMTNHVECVVGICRKDL